MIFVYICHMRTLLTIMAVATTVLLGACTHHKKAGTIITPDAIAVCHEGDILLRQGTGTTSHIVTAADGNTPYSHCAIVATDSSGTLVAVHAVPGEPDDNGRTDCVKAEPIREFYSEIRATRGCILRYADAETAHKAACEAMRLAIAHTPFDHDYDCTDTTTLYCTQLVELCYARHGATIAPMPRHNFCLPTTKFKKLRLPGDFARSPRLQCIVQF